VFPSARLMKPETPKAPTGGRTRPGRAIGHTEENTALQKHAACSYLHILKQKAVGSQICLAGCRIPNTEFACSSIYTQEFHLNIDSRIVIVHSRSPTFPPISSFLNLRI
jgi:hypothetical protein